MKLGGRVMIIFASLVTKTYTYLIDDSDENKKAKDIKKWVKKKKISKTKS